VGRPAPARSNLVLLKRPGPAASANADTVGALEQLLRSARNGDIIGLAFTALLPGQQYMVDVVGEAYRDPTWTRGAVAAVDDELRALIHEAGNVAPDYRP
jgi:hypothetical protein